MPNAVLVKYRKHGSALSVKDLRASAAVDKEFNSSNAGKFMKKLMDKSTKFKAINSKLTESYNKHKAVTMPFLDDGFRALNVDMLEEYTKTIAKDKSDLQSLLRDLKPEWDNEVAADIGRLAGLGDIKDYPTWQEIESKYSIETKFLPYPEAADYRFSVDKSIIDDLQTMKEQAKIEGRREVYSRVDKLVSAAMVNCSKDKPRIHESMLENMADLADVMQYLNIHSDAEMNVVAEKLKELSGLVTTFNLRNDPVVRQNFSKEAEEFLKRLRSGNWYEDLEEVESEMFEVPVQTCEQSHQLQDSVI